MTTTGSRNIPIQGEETGTSTEAIKPKEEIKEPAGRPRAESDVEMGKESGMTTTTTTTTSASEQKDADELLLWLGRYAANRNHPRPTTGTIRAYKSGEVLTVQSDEKVSRIFQKLITEGFLSAPVLDAQHRYTGYNIDLLDLVYHTLQCFHEWRTTTTTSGDTSGAQGPTAAPAPTVDFWNTYFQRDEFVRSHAMDVITKNPWRVYRHEHIATGDFSTLYCMEVMARLNQHRVVIIDRNWVVQNIVTQSMIISLISQNMHRLGSLRDMKIDDLMDLLPPNVETVKETDLTAEAYNLMGRAHVSGVAVVDGAGNLVDTLSVRDLRGIGSNAQNFMRLWLPVKAFKEEVRKQYERQTPKRPLVVTPNDTFEKIIENMFDGNIHRVWVVKDVREPKPLRVCTQRDVIRILLFKMGQPLPPV